MTLITKAIILSRLNPPGIRGGKRRGSLSLNLLQMVRLKMRGLLSCRATPECHWELAHGSCTGQCVARCEDWV